jgi:hypothetical protein
MKIVNDFAELVNFAKIKHDYNEYGVYEELGY